MFLCCDSYELNTYLIYPEWRLTTDHILLTITIPITKEHITTCKRTIIKNSDEEDKFIEEVIASFTKLNLSKISNISDLEKVVFDFANIVDHTWMKYSKLINITKHSKSWWNDKCNCKLENYRFSKSIKSWKSFRKTVKSTKREFFDLKIQEIANKKQGPWELMNWVNKYKLPAIEMIKYNGNPCLELADL